MLPSHLSDYTFHLPGSSSEKGTGEKEEEVSTEPGMAEVPRVSVLDGQEERKGKRRRMDELPTEEQKRRRERQVRNDFSCRLKQRIKSLRKRLAEEERVEIKRLESENIELMEKELVRMREAGII